MLTVWPTLWWRSISPPCTVSRPSWSKSAWPEMQSQHQTRNLSNLQHKGLSTAKKEKILVEGGEVEPGDISNKGLSITYVRWNHSSALNHVGEVKGHAQSSVWIWCQKQSQLWETISALEGKSQTRKILVISSLALLYGRQGTGHR